VARTLYINRRGQGYRETISECPPVLVDTPSPRRIRLVTARARDHQMSLTKVHHPMPSEGAARAALTDMRKHYRIALRGAVACEEQGLWYLHVPFGGTGFSPGEFASALRARNH
jgi:hypothetical protein